jgi:zinc protease
VRLVSLVCAALGMGPLLLGCRPPRGAGVPALGAVVPPVSVGGRQTRVAFELPNGLRVILEENHVTPVVALQLWVGAGSADETPGEAGLAHVAERVAVGAAPAPGSEDGEAHLEAWTTLDATVFQTVVASPFVGAGLDALAAPLARAPVDARTFEHARADVLPALARAARDGATVATDAVMASAFAGHGYGRGVLGTEATVDALSAADVEAFRDRCYGAANATLVIVGDVDGRALRARVAATFGGAPRGARIAARSAPAPLAGPRVTAAAGDDGDGRLVASFGLPALADADLPAIDVLGAALARADGAGGAAGRLARALVRNRELARDVRAEVFAGRDAGLLLIEAPLVAGRADEATRVLLDETLALARDELPATEFEAARAAVAAELARAAETDAGYARRLGFFATLARDPAAADRYRERLDALTPARVADVAARVLRASNLALGASLPEPSGAATVAATAGRLRDAATACEARADARGTGALAAPRDVTSFADVVRVVLPSGPRVLVLRDPTVATVSVRALWSGGLRVEDARSNGVTSLLAATLTRGTRTRDAARVAADAAALGGSLEGVAGRDELGLRAEFLARHADEGLALVADCLAHPSFPEAEVERARLAQLDRARAGEDDAAAVASRLFAATLWPSHPYRLPLSGTGESLAALTRRRLVDHYRTFYGAANLTIAVVGDVSVERVVGVLRAAFADAPAPLGLTPVRPRDVPALAAEVFEDVRGADVRVVVGYPAPALGDPERRAAEVLGRVLGGRGGRLAREGVVAPVADAALWSGVDAGAFSLELASTPGELDAAVPALRAALAHVLAAGFSEAEVAGARRALVAADARALARRDAVAAALARDEAFGLGAGAYRRAAVELAAVTPEAVARVARRVLDPSRQIVAAARPPAPPPTVAKASPPRSAPKPGTGGGRASAP